MAILRTGLAALLGVSVFCCTVSSFASPVRMSIESRSATATTESADAHIVDVVAITEVFADGLKVSAVAVQYDKNIRDASLKASDFTVTTDVPGQTITRIYTSTDGLQTAKRGLNGRYVILELSTNYVIPVSTHKMPTPMPPTGGPPQGTRPPEPPKAPIILDSEVVAKVGNVIWDPGAHPATLKSSKHGGNGKSVAVSQTGDIATTDGTMLTTTTTPKDNVYVHNLIVDGFMKPDFSAGTHGNVKYNIHFPSNYDPAKKYPVVFFLDDSDSPTGFTHAEYLIHGQGGVIWASKDDEARHPAIVVVPALSRALINESYEPAVQTRPGGVSSTPYLSILDLLDGLPALVPNIDTSRIYLTGQGDGARAALRMMEDRPDVFAAALLFAPDYDPSKIAPLAKSKMWIVVSEGDAASYSSMQSSMASLKAAGAHVGEATWNGRARDAELISDVHGMAGGKNNVEFTVFKTGTVVPPGVTDDAADNHAYTWRIGYSVAALRDWLLVQKK